MKPKGYIDDNHFPFGNYFSSRNIEEKLDLRKSIKKRCRSWIIISLITAVIFGIFGIIFIVDHSSYYAGAVCILITLFWGYFGYVYIRILCAPTAKEMHHHLDKLFNFSIFVGDEPPVRGLIYGTGAVAVFIFDKEFNFNWYVTLLALIAVPLLIYVIIWLWRKFESGNFPQENKLENEIEKLMDLEGE